MADPDASGEQRFVSLGSDPNGRVLREELKRGS